jgi:trehalose 6-phosphate synthase
LTVRYDMKDEIIDIGRIRRAGRTPMRDASVAHLRPGSLRGGAARVTSTGGHGVDFVVVANRLPVDLERLEDGTERWRHSPGGLVSALEPFLQARKGAWIGWPGVADAHVPSFFEKGMLLHPVALSAAEVQDYYEGFSNATLWPLYHDAVAPPEFHRTWWDSYVKVNRRFADAAAAITAEGATVWIQDYQLQLVPAMLREQRPDLRIGFFLHIPFPPVELFMRLPWRTEIIRGLLGADLVGFQVAGGAQNFHWLARRLLDGESAATSETDVGARSRSGAIQVDGRQVQVGAFPISIDAQKFDDLSRREDINTRAQQLRADLGDPKRGDPKKAADHHDVSISGMKFDPDKLEIKPGDTVVKARKTKIVKWIKTE